MTRQDTTSQKYSFFNFKTDVLDNLSLDLDKPTINQLHALTVDDAVLIKTKKFFFLSSPNPKFENKANLVFLALFNKNFSFLEKNLDNIDFNAPFLSMDFGYSSPGNYSIGKHVLLLGNILPPRLMHKIMAKLSFDAENTLGVFSYINHFSDHYLLTLLNYINTNNPDILKSPKVLSEISFSGHSILDCNNNNQQTINNLKKIQTSLTKIISLLGTHINDNLNTTNTVYPQDINNPNYYKKFNVGDFILHHLLKENRFFDNDANIEDVKQYLIPTFQYLLSSPYKLKNQTLSSCLRPSLIKDISPLFLNQQKYLLDHQFISFAFLNNDLYFDIVNQKFPEETFNALKAFFDSDCSFTHIKMAIDADKVKTLNDIFLKYNYLPQHKDYWQILLKTNPSLIQTHINHSNFKLLIKQIKKQLIETKDYQTAKKLDSVLEKIKLDPNATGVSNKKKIIL